MTALKHTEKCKVGSKVCIHMLWDFHLFLRQINLRVQQAVQLSIPETRSHVRRLRTASVPGTLGSWWNHGIKEWSFLCIVSYSSKPPFTRIYRPVKAQLIPAEDIHHLFRTHTQGIVLAAFQRQPPISGIFLAPNTLLDSLTFYIDILYWYL